jgi:SP family sugar:H+ symporter-like MFS transporter
MLAGYHGYIALGILLATSITDAADRFTGVSAYRLTLACQLIWPVCMAICVYFRPESPRLLVHKGRNEDAYRSLAMVRNPNPQCQSDIRRVGMELTEIYLSHESDLAPVTPSFRKSIAQWLQARREGTSSEVGIRVHPLTISIILQLMYHCTGMFFFAFSIPLLADMDDFPSNSITITLLLSTVMLGGTSVYILVSKKLGHRLTLVVGALSLSICHLITAITSINGNFDHKGLTVDYYQTILITFALFLGSSSWAPGMWVIVGEISSMATRCRDTGISLGVHWFCAAFTAAATPFIMDVKWSGRFGIFLIFACLCLCCSLFVHLFVPETSRLFLEYIQVMMEESDPRMTRKWRPVGTFGWWKDRRTDVRSCRVPKIRKSPIT